MKKLILFVAGICIAIAVLLVGLFIYGKTSLESALLPPPEDPDRIANIEALSQVQPQSRRPAPTLTEDFKWSHIFSPSKESMPWTRWWWPGGDVSHQDISQQLSQLNNAGFGGVEIQAFKTGMSKIKNKAILERVHSIHEDQFFKTLADTITEAKKYGRQVEHKHGSGWPPGGQNNANNN